MSPAISLCLLMSMSMLTSAVRNATNARRKITVRSDASTQTGSENLRIILNYVRHEQRMSNLATVSLVYLNAHSDLVDLVSRYVTSESIVSYKITTNNLSRKCTWQNRMDLVWILIIDDLELLNFFVYEQSHIWKATNQYLIIITAENVSTKEPPREIFQSIWRNYSVHRIVTVSIREEFRCFNRYLPFEKNQRNEYGVVRKVCLMDRQDRVELYDKFEKLNEYPIRVIVFSSQMMNIVFDKDMKNVTVYKRLDADVMFLLEKTMEAKFLIEVIRESCKGDPFHLSLRYIENGESDLIVTSFFIKSYKEFHRFEFTASIYDDRLCLIAPAAGFLPKSYMPILPFTLDVWTVLAVYNLLVSVLWFLISYYSVSFRRREAILLPLMAEKKPAITRLVVVASTLRRSHLSDSPPRINSYVLSCFDLVETLCYPLKEDSAGGTTAQRALLFGTLFFGLIVTGLYQSCLVSSLSDPFHYPELTTLEDVANSNLTIITKYENLKEDTFTENTTLINRLKEKVKVIPSNKRTNDLVAFDRNVTALGRYASVKLDNLSMYFDEEGNELLHIVEECLTTNLLSYVLRLYSPYRERINGLLLRMQEGGLVELWYRNMTYPIYADEQRRKMAKSDRRIKLTLEHYSLTFLGLSLGLLLCAIVFLGELYFANRPPSENARNFP